MLGLMCPKCASHTYAEGSNANGICPACGSTLISSEGARNGASDCNLELLAADLREAFGFHGSSAGDCGPARVAGGPVPAGGADSPCDGFLGEGVKRLADFEILEELGRGGMGIVYRARQLSLNRLVALKILPAPPHGGATCVSRFLRESRAAARLHHTNIVPIYAQGQKDGVFYYAMELIEGVSLDRVLRWPAAATSLTIDEEAFNTCLPDGDAGSPTRIRGDPVHGKEPRGGAVVLRRTRGDYRRIARLGVEVAEALDHAHRCGVVHRDIKPQNLLLGRDDRLHITDFGLAQILDEPHITLTGEWMGTPSYMAPEQIQGGLIDGRTDVYSLGVTLYELLTLRLPFEGATRDQVVQRILESEPPRPRQLDPRIPLDFETACLHALEKAPSRRYASAGALAVDLRRFAGDQPILARRIGWAGRSLKWARRHRAASTAIALSIVALAMSIAWLATLIASEREAAAARRTQANQYVRRAYDQLVYQDYRSTPAVESDIRQAEALGADAARLHFVQALAAVGQADLSMAASRLAELLKSDRFNHEAQYLLGFVQWQQDDVQAALNTIRIADQQGGPQSAAEWFFRGLAIHRENPQEAIHAYQEARRLRALERQFFPQATLHLARAYNQDMYRTRRTDAVTETAGMLRDLISYQVYGSYPYHLLSITHRLAAEVYEEREGKASANAEFHFRQALQWARQGQEVGGGESDGPYTAEAECHESMGDFDAAIAARTTAIELAKDPLRRAEGYGYRWRLNYWQGRFDAALDDLRNLQEAEPRSIVFHYFYPLLVLAEAGRMDEAAELAYALAADAPQDAISTIWSATALRVLGRTQEAMDLLMSHRERVDFTSGLLEPQTPQWVETLYRFLSYEASLGDLLLLAETAESPWRLTGEAYFHAGVRELATGNRTTALEHFEQAYLSFDSEKRYTYHAKVFRVKLQQDPNWPAWIVQHSGGNDR